MEKQQIDINTQVSIISDDFWAGEFYRHFNLPYLTPTVGLAITSRYLDFLQNLQQEDAFNLEFITSKFSYPVARTSYAKTIEFQHYQTEEEAREKFLRRAERINWSNLCIKIDLGKPHYTLDDIELWNTLQLPNSIALYPSHRFEPGIEIHNGVQISAADWTLDGAKMFNISRQYFDLLHWIKTGNVQFQQIKQWAIAHGQTFPNTPSDLAITPVNYLQKAVEVLPQGELIELGIDGRALCQTYDQLWNKALDLWSNLDQAKISSGRFVIILTESCQDLVTAFWSCLMGGFVAIPIRYSSHSTQPHPTWVKLERVLGLVDNPIIVTTQAIAAQFYQHFSALPNLPIFCLDKLEVRSPQIALHPTNPEDLAALFLSSGTTGDPKLVAFSGQTIVNRWIATGPASLESSSLSWLPFDHASACFRLVNADVKRKIFLSTERFLQSPGEWLKAIEKYQVTQVSITNFGMALVNQVVQASPKASWHLNSVQNLGIGAETIDPVIYQTFLQGLMPFGLFPQAVFTGYGLTECGTVVSGQVSRDLTVSENNLLSLSEQCIPVGKPLPGYSVRIVNEDNDLLPMKEIGNIQIKGPATTGGYYKNEEQTIALFTEGGWIQTGDLGFMDQENLVITGRSKDIIVVNAKNYTYQEIETLVTSINNLEPHMVIAGSLRQLGSTTDELALFIIRPVLDYENFVELTKQIRVTLATRLGISPGVIVPIKEAEIPRTSMGKVQRRKLIQNVKDGQYEPRLQILSQLIADNRRASFVTPSTQTEKAIAKIWSDVLQNPSISLHDNFFDLGGRSIVAAQIISNIREELELELPLHILFENPTITELVTYIDGQSNHQTAAQFAIQTSVISLKPTGKKTPLYFVNSTSSARALIPLVDVEQPLYSLNIFSLTYRINKAFDQLEIKDFAAYLIKDLQAVHPHGPYKLIGFCQDGALTLEIAQQLSYQEELVELVCFIDVLFQKQTLNLWQHLQVLQKIGLPYIITNIKPYILIIKKQKLINQRLKNRNKNQIEIAKKIEMDKKLYAAYLKAAASYHPLPYNKKIVAFQSIEWSYKDMSNLQAISKNGLDCYQIKGLHHHLFEEPSIHEFVEKLMLF